MRDERGGREIRHGPRSHGQGRISFFEDDGSYLVRMEEDVPRQWVKDTKLREGKNGPILIHAFIAKKASWRSWPVSE